METELPSPWLLPTRGLRNLLALGLFCPALLHAQDASNTNGSMIPWILAVLLGIGLIILTGKVATLKKQTTKLRDSVKSLHEEEALYRAMLNALENESIVLVSTSGTVLAVNSAAARRFEKRPDELLGRDYFKLYPPVFASKRQRELKRAVESRKPLHVVEDEFDRSLVTVFAPILSSDSGIHQVAIYAREAPKSKQG